MTVLGNNSFYFNDFHPLYDNGVIKSARENISERFCLLSGRETKVIQPTVLQIVFNRITEFFDFLPIRFTSRRVYCRRDSVILRYSILIKSVMINLACVPIVSVWFQSKERQRNGIFGFGRARNWQTSGQKLNQGEGEGEGEGEGKGKGT